MGGVAVSLRAWLACLAMSWAHGLALTGARWVVPSISARSLEQGTFAALELPLVLGALATRTCTAGGAARARALHEDLARTAAECAARYHHPSPRPPQPVPSPRLPNPEGAHIWRGAGCAVAPASHPPHLL
ncbi:hypothetical protein T492DRAFT_834459 [Pavlovales sp. CCMP2436]|nr:hypothetical protein T492DRAFT_834459 [Pavlovales sp. CCMP2436]